MSMAARNAASISKCVVSSKCASGAAFKGAIGRVDALARLLQLGGAAARAHLRSCGDEDFHVRVGKNHCSDVAAVKHSTGRRPSELALKRQHELAHLRDGRDERGRLADGLPLERRLVEMAGIERLGSRHGARVVVGRVAGIEHGLGHGAVNQPRIEVAQAVVALAKLAATARTGYSSIMDGARAAGTSTPRSIEARTRKSATSPPPALRMSSTSISAPISRSVTMSPVRNGLVMTSVRITSEPGTINAATMGNAAEDGSAGTTTGAGASSGSPRTVILRPCAPSASILTSAPKCLSRRSV